MEDQFHSSIEIELRDPIAPGPSSLGIEPYSGVHTEVRGAEDESWKFPSQELEKYLVDKDDVKFTNRKQRAFYKHQNQLIEEILETERNANKINTEEEDDEDAKLSALQLRAKKIAIYSSAAVNILLFVIKTYAAITSGSLTVIASALDSFLDLLSGSIIFLTEFISSRVSSEKYPVGKSRFEPVGLVIFSSCMFMATIQLLLTSVKSLITKESSLDVSTTTFIIIGTTIVLKSILFIYCRTVKSSSAHALAMDHRNDIITNTFGILSVFLSRYYWEIDSVGAIIISFYVMFIWARTCYEQLVPLTGGSASKDFLNAITFVARQHHPDVIAIDTVRAYHIGYNYVVELDIVMDPQTPLHHAHDVGEALQIKLERLANVDRAFVHLDYEVEHKPEHKKTT